MSRKYASFFEYPDRSRKERGVVEELIRELAENGRSGYILLDGSPDPPDCRARNGAGDSVGFEVTELVAQEAVRLSANGENVLAMWTPESFLDATAERLRSKDEKTLNAGPYFEYIVVIHTAEFFLTSQFVESALKGAKFGPFKQITSGFLILSYDAHVGRYPIFDLPIE